MGDATLLPELLRHESRSYLQYIRESFPWAKGKDEELRAQVLALAEAERQGIAGLACEMQKRRITLPYLGAFPTSFTTSNFISLSFLLPRLVAEQRKAVAEVERDLAKVADAELRARLESYRDLKRKHVQELESLAGQPQAA
jgi:hypothetical protein